MNPALRRLIGVVVSLAFFLGAIGVFSALIIPASVEIKDLRGQKNALAELLDSETTKVSTVLNLFEKYGDASELRDKLSMELPPKEEIPSVINQLQGIAKASGVTINSLNINLPAISSGNKNDVIKPVGVVQTNLVLEGNYSAIKKYVESIETNIRVMDIQKLDLQGGTEGETMTYNMVVNAYYQL